MSSVNYKEQEAAVRVLSVKERDNDLFQSVFSENNLVAVILRWQRTFISNHLCVVK